jgi:hypothetical protein
MRRDPEFRLLTADALRERLRDGSHTTWVMTPRKEYDDLERLAGLPLQRVYEDAGVGLFTPAAAGTTPAAAATSGDVAPAAGGG